MALNRNSKKYLNMVWELGLMEFKMRDQGTLLGFLWTMLHPLLYFIVLYGLFKKWMGHYISNFPLYLIIGIVQWNFFASATTNTITAVMRHRSYVKNIRFPKEVLVLSSILSVLFSHVLEVAVLIIFWMLIGKIISPVVILLGPIMLLNIYLALGLGFILATAGVHFLDIQRIWGIFTSVGLFLTPIFYSLDLLAPDKRNIILMNPMTHIIQSTRKILIDGEFPDISGLIYVIFVSSVILAFGYFIFKKYEGHFAEKI